MKSELVEAELDYNKPQLVQSITDKKVVLVTPSNHVKDDDTIFSGVVVYGGLQHSEYQIGYYHRRWSKECFEKLPPGYSLKISM